MNPARAEGAMTIRGLVFIPFPDGEDGLVLPEHSSFDPQEFQRIAADRQRCLNAIRTGLVHAGWGTHRESAGIWSLGRSCVSSSINVGFPLSYSLRSQSWLSVAREYLASWHRSRKPINDRQLNLWAEQESTSESAALYHAHLAREQEIFDSAIDIDPEESDAERLQQVEAEIERNEAAHWSEIHSRRSQLISMETEFEAILSRTRERLRNGESLWLGLKPDWIHPSDTWVQPSELRQWARAQSIFNAFYAGYASLRIHDSQDHQLHIEALREFLADERTGYGHDVCVPSLAFAMSVPEARKRLINPYSPLRDYCQLPDQGEYSVLYGGYAELHRCLAAPRRDLLHWVATIEDVVNDMGWWNAARVIGPDAASSREIVAACKQLLACPADNQELAVWTGMAAKLALAFHADALAMHLLSDLRLRKAAQELFGRRYWVLGEICLALSLLRPGRECLSLIEEAYANMQAAYDHDRVDNTALALAIAWHRCQNALGR